MVRLFFAIAAIFGATAVAGGAFASHALREQLSERMLAIFETGVRYQMYHALALLVLALWAERVSPPSPWLIAAGFAFISGIVIFSGSLYALSLSGIKILGAITPLGGVALIFGWACLVVAALTGPLGQVAPK
jgi:uncharacterized membrane protein YgdD (TMEM256/DUF423 family)